MASRQVVAFVAVLTVSGSAVAALSLRGEPVRRVKWDVEQGRARHVAPRELAEWIIQGRRDFTVVDLRPGDAYDQAHVRDAVSCGSCHEDRSQARHAQEEHFIDLGKKLVVYTETGKEAVELPRLLAQNPRLHVLQGGFDGWKKDVLAPVTFDGVTDEDQLAGLRRREAVRAFFSGERPVTATPAKLPVTPIRREGAHQAAAPKEGC